MAVPKEEEPLNRVTVEPASAVPEIAGVESVVAEEVDKDVGASGAVESAEEPISPGSRTFPKVVSASYLPLSRT